MRYSAPLRSEMGLVHEYRRSTRRCATVQEMKGGRSRSAIRCDLKPPIAAGQSGVQDADYLVRAMGEQGSAAARWASKDRRPQLS